MISIFKFYFTTKTAAEVVEAMNIIVIINIVWTSASKDDIDLQFFPLPK